MTKTTRIGEETQTIDESRTAPPVVALFNASDDTVEMVQRMLDASGIHCLVNCRFADLRKGVVDFAGYLSEHDPQCGDLRHLTALRAELGLLSDVSR
jgi:hypothetical protein